MQRSARAQFRIVPLLLHARPLWSVRRFSPVTEDGMEQKDKRSELLEEYYKLAAIVQGYDSYYLSIKAWGVTVSGAAIGVGFSIGKPIQVFVVAFALSLAFWLTEVRFKLFQLGHMFRIAQLEEALQNETKIISPRIFRSFQEESSRNILVKRWRSVLFWPQVMFPHIFLPD